MSLKDEFKWVKFYLEHNNPFDFHMPRWISINPIYLVVTRGTFALYCFVLMIIGIAIDVGPITKEHPPKWLTFLTSWNYVFVTLYFMLAFGLSLSEAVLEYRGKAVTTQNSDESNPINPATNSGIYNSTTEDENNPESKLPWKLKIFWIIFNVTINICTLVVIGYWALVHDYKKEEESKLVLYLSIDRHGINLLLVVIDFFLHKIPYRILHFIYPAIVMLAYILFNLIYWAISGDGVYSFVKWGEKPGHMIGVVIGVIIIVSIIQVAWYFIHKGKEHLHSKTYKVKESILYPDHENV